MENKTPAQLAKDYAAQYGFVITPVERRYVITYPGAQYDTHVADVGGYPAALNAMRKYTDALRVAEYTGPACEDIDHTQDAAKTEASIAWFKAARVLDDREDPFGATLQADAARADVDFAKKYWRERIEEARKRRAPRHSHSVQWRYKGGRTHSQPYPSHAEALKAVRQMMCNKRMRPDYVNIVPVGVTA